MSQKTEPKVSIVIPVYNGSNFLAKALDSALEQTYKNVEIIVVNDGSNDGGATEEVAMSYGNRIRYYKKQNGGVATALNFGIEKMTGTYFSWLSHDDLYEKTKIEEQVRLIRQYRRDDVIVASNAYVLFENGIKKKEQIDKKTFEYFDIFLATSAAVGVNGCSLLIPRRALVDSGGFDANLPVTQDYDLWFRLSSRFKYRFALLERPLVVYRRHNEQDSVQKREMLLEASDSLRYKILKTVDYKRFEKYFFADKTNIRRSWDNYALYKSRNYKKTAPMLLKSILRYYYENDREKFYKVYRSEIETYSGATEDRRRKLLRSSKLTDSDRKSIIRGYNKLLKSRTDNYPVKLPTTVHNPRAPKSRIHDIVRRFGDSIKRDGIYLTGEKIISKMHSKVIKGRKSSRLN